MSIVSLEMMLAISANDTCSNDFKISTLHCSGKLRCYDSRLISSMRCSVKVKVGSASPASANLESMIDLQGFAALVHRICSGKSIASCVMLAHLIKARRHSNVQAREYAPELLQSVQECQNILERIVTSKIELTFMMDQTWYMSRRNAWSIWELLPDKWIRI